MKRLGLAGLVIITFICITVSGYADIPRVINYQGRFTDKENNPLTGNYLVTFRLYDEVSGEAALWEEGHILTINNGMFNVLLGSIKPLDIAFDKDIWLGIEVASDGEMNPRIKLASSAYAINAQAIDMLDSTQLLRNDIDSVMTGSLTLKKDLILKGDAHGPSKVVLTDAQGREYYLWMDNNGNLRLKQGLPASETDGAIVGGPDVPSIIHKMSSIIIIAALAIIGVFLYVVKKK